jgi:hypothetical protein
MFALICPLLSCRMVMRAQIDEFEMALLANLTPENSDEALSIIPSLQVCHKQNIQPAAQASQQQWLPGCGCAGRSAGCLPRQLLAGGDA